MRVLIDGYGWQGAMFILGGIIANIGVCASLFRPTQLEYQNRLSRTKRNERGAAKTPDGTRKECQTNAVDDAMTDKLETPDIETNQTKPGINHPVKSTDQNLNKTALQYKQEQHTPPLYIGPLKAELDLLSIVIRGVSESFWVEIVDKYTLLFLSSSQFLLWFVLCDYPLLYTSKSWKCWHITIQCRSFSFCIRDRLCSIKTHTWLHHRLQHSVSFYIDIIKLCDKCCC